MGSARSVESALVTLSHLTSDELTVTEEVLSGLELLMILRTDEASWDNATAPATGIQHVIVNGVPTISNGTYTGATAGRVLRGPGASVELEQVK